MNVNIIPLLVLQAFAYPAYAVDDIPNADLLEWLGMISDTSEIGIDINDLIERYDNAATSPDATEQTGNDDSSISPGTEQ